MVKSLPATTRLPLAMIKRRPGRKQPKATAAVQPLVSDHHGAQHAVGAIASGTRSVAINVGNGPFAITVQTGDGAQVLQLPAEAYRSIAEVEAPPGIDNVESLPGWFEGREIELARLDTALIGGGAPVVIAAVHGLGGIGKSSLAAYWAVSRSHGCVPIVWISAESRVGVERGLAGFATRLQPALAKALTVDELAERGKQWLATHAGWLLILDNVEDPADIAAVVSRARTGRILITGRLSVPWPPGTEVISLGVLAADEAQRLLIGLITSTGQRDLDGLSELCETLGYLPLAIWQAGAYLAHQRFMTPRSYRRLLIDQPGPTLDRAAAGTDPQRTIARIWRVTLDRIAEIEPAAVELLRTLAWYAPDDILLALCQNVADQPTVDAALGVLAAYNMITPDPDREKLSVHRLVQAVARTPDPTDPHRDSSAIERARSRAAETLYENLPDAENPAAWPTWRALLPHIDALTDYTRSESTTAVFTAIRNKTGLFLLQQGMHPSALAHLRQALTDREQIFGLDHPHTLASRNNLAYALVVVGRAAEAIPIHERIVIDCERILGPDQPDTLTSRHNLADAYASAGRVDEAIPLFERTLIDRERILGSEHRDTLTSRNGLANAYLTAGRVAEAIPLHQQLLDDRSRILGSDHTHTLASRYNLAHSLTEAGRLEEAIPHFKQTNADCDRILGPDHPSTLVSRRGLAMAYASAGRLREAILIYEQTVSDCERVFGGDHPETLASRNNLACALRAGGRFAEAISLHKQTLADCERILGSSNPNTMLSRNNLAGAYQLTGRMDEAIPLFEQTRDERARVLGANHPGTLTSRSNLADAYMLAGRVEEAISLHQRLLADRERVLGLKHPDTLGSRSSLAIAQKLAGRVGDAISLHKRVLRDRERILGPDHPHTLASRHNIADAYMSAGQVAEAIPLFEQAHTDCERILGGHHPDTLTVRENLAFAYEEVGRVTEAIRLYEQTLADRERILGLDHPQTTLVRRSLIAARQKRDSQ